MYTVAVMLYAPVCASNFIDYSGQEGHSSIYGSRMRTPAIDQLTVNGWTFQHSVDQWNAQLSTMHLSSKCACCSMVSGSNIKQVIVKMCLLLTGDLLVVGMSNHQPSIDQPLKCASVNH